MLYKIIDSFVVDGIINQRISLEVPLDHQDPTKGDLVIVANVIQKHDPAIHTNTQVNFPEKPKPIAYLQGGPGFPCDVALSNSGYIKVLLQRNHQVVMYDQRGTGLSSPIEVASLERAVSKQELGDKKLVTDRQLDYILNFRADSIVEDMELVRVALFGANVKWLLLGQSYGGFCSFTYLSRYPESLNAVMVTGGVPPIGLSPDRVYQQTYNRTKERNEHYYRKYPHDVQRVKAILEYLSKNDVKLPNGGTLSVERFQQLGIKFGGSGGTDSLHVLVTDFWWALQSQKAPTYTILNRIQNETSFDTNVIYALFQEAIYNDGTKANQKSSWAADRTRYHDGNDKFVYSEKLALSPEPVYFTGEMVYKSMFEDYVELASLKQLAYALHENNKWSVLYDTNKLGKLKWEDVPIVSATYVYDQYVDFHLTMEVKEKVFHGNGNLRQYITSEFFHNGLRADPEKVLGSLFKLLEGEVD